MKKLLLGLAIWSVIGFLTYLGVKFPSTTSQIASFIFVGGGILAVSYWTGHFILDE